MTKRELIEALEASPLPYDSEVTLYVFVYDELGTGLCKTLPIDSIELTTLELQAEES